LSIHLTTFSPPKLISNFTVIIGITKIVTNDHFKIVYQIDSNDANENKKINNGRKNSRGKRRKFTTMKRKILIPV
jgi:hypothetical protein